MGFVHRPECTQILEAVERGETIIHIGGGPGIGKSATLEWLTSTLDDSYDTHLFQLYATHDVESLTKAVHSKLYESLPLRQRLKYRLSDINGLQLSSFGIEFETQSDNIDDLKTVAALIPDEKTVVLCIDDIHKLADEKRNVQDSIVRLADSLPANVRIVSAGRILFEGGSETVIELHPLSKEQVEELLQATAGIEAHTAHQLYDRIGGYPYYFALLSESNQQITADGSIPDLTEHEFRRYIEENYLQSLDTNEERFLRQTVPLIELDEHICCLAVPELTRTDARRVLSTLRDRCIVEDSGYDQSVRKHRLHDNFREFLCDLERTDRTVEQLLEHLPEAPVEDRQRITEALAEIAADDPTHLEDVIDRVVSPLNDDDRQVRRNASVIVARLAAKYPKQVNSAALSTAIEFLESDDTLLRQAAGRQLAELAKSNPRALGPHIDPLRDVIERQDEKYPPYAPTIVARLAEEYPKQMRPVVLQLKQQFERSVQTVLFSDVESFGELEEQYDQVEFALATPPYADEVSEPSRRVSTHRQTRNSSPPNTRSTPVTDDIQMSKIEFPEDTDVMFTDEIEQLHRSQYAEVLKVWYRTKHKKRPAVLKQLLTDKEGFTRQFKSEVDLWGQIDDHENVVTLLDRGTQPRRWFLMEYLDGGSLSDRLDQIESSHRELETSVIERILDGICDAVSYAHAHDIVHGDLTPSNVLFPSKEDWSLQVGDWGQAQQLTGVSEATMIYSAAAPTVEGVTLPYAAPEMVDPETFGEIDKRTDVYQIAMIAYELYTSQRPFTASSPATLMRQHLEERPPLPSEVSGMLPPELDTVFETALAKEKSDRYQSVEELRAALVH